MNFYFLNALLSGKLMTTSKFEGTMNLARQETKRYRQIEKTEKYKEYQALKEVVESAAFLATKKKIKGTKYADSDEAKKLALLASLSKNKAVRAFLKDGADAENSNVVRYNELKAEVETPEFKKMDAFWKDANRWATTPEGKQEARFVELSKDEDIVFMQKAHMPLINKYEQYEMLWQDDFLWTNMKESDWKPGFAYPDGFKAVHSYTNEAQAYVGGRNVETRDSKLYINTKKEQVEGAAWDDKKGLVMTPFEYSSDVIYMDKIAIEEGMTISVKARCHGFLNHGIYLRSKKHLPFISVFDYTGLNLWCGLKDSIKSDKQMKKLDGLQPIVDTVFAVTWLKDEIIWEVNNLEVYRTKNTLPKGEKLYLHCYSFLFNKSRRKSEGKLEVDWIRIYRNL